MIGSGIKVAYTFQTPGVYAVFLQVVNEIGESDVDPITITVNEPSSPDSDGDGLPDFQEVDTYGTDPFDADTDHDGLSDGQEVRDLDPAMPGVQNPYNPLDADSTGNNGQVGADGVLDGLNDWDGDGTPNAAQYSLAWSTYLGGSGYENTSIIALDTEGNIWVGGVTSSSDFPKTAGAFDTTPNGGNDAFVAKLSPDGKTLLFATILGGSGDDQLSALLPDETGVYLVGRTSSPNFPVLATPYSTYRGGNDVFVAKLNSTGNGLVFSALLGGAGNDEVGTVYNPIVRDTSGALYIAGLTTSPDFPTTAGAYDRTYNGGTRDGFVFKLTPNASQLLYSTYLGGSGDDFARCLAINAAGEAFVTGGTASPNFPVTLGAFDTTLSGTQDAWVTRLNATGSGLLYSTYLGGSGIELAAALQLRPSGEAVILGRTRSADFPASSGAYCETQSAPSDQDLFVAELDASGANLVHATYLGGIGSEMDKWMTLDDAGNVWVGGVTSALDFPITPGAYQPSFGGGSNDTAIARLTPDLSRLTYGTYLGGSGSEDNPKLALVGTSTLYVAGLTGSADFPVIPGSFDTTFAGGGWDAFAAKLDLTGVDADSDGDGLSNFEEVETYGTDPLNPDSDGDDLSDGDEVNRYGTDPLVVDGRIGYDASTGLLPEEHDARWVFSDQNNPPSTVSVSDGILTFTNALSNRAQWVAQMGHGPGVSPDSGVFLETTVRIVSEEHSSTTRGVQLASVGEAIGSLGNSLDLYGWQDRIFAIGSTGIVGEYLMDTTDTFHTYRLELLGGQFAVFVDGVLCMTGVSPASAYSAPELIAFAFGNWSVSSGSVTEWSRVLGGVLSTDPTGADRDSDGLSDADEGTRGTNPFLADTDEDGLTDGEEVNTYGTDPVTTDTDGDGLSDGDEVNTYATGPFNADSDGDGLSDGDEVSTHATDPLKADSDGDGRSDSDEIAAGTDPTDPYSFTREDYDDEAALVWSTFLGGSMGEIAKEMVVDSEGSVYVVGTTNSHDFPTTPGAFQTSFVGGPNVIGRAGDTAYVSKLNSTATALAFSTFLDGSGDELVMGCCLDSAENLFVVGTTASPDFPTTENTYDQTYNGGLDVFVAKFSPMGDLLFCTYLGGSGNDDASEVDNGGCIAVDSADNIYVTGRTSSGDFPVTSGAFDETHNGGNDVFVAKLSPDGAQVQYATFLGGANEELGLDIAVNEYGEACVVGQTNSADYPTTSSAYDQTSVGVDSFVTKLTSDGSGLAFSTFLGGDVADEALKAVVFNANGDIYLAGATKSSDYPTTPGAFNTVHSGNWDVALSLLSGDGSTLLASTLLGGNNGDSAIGVALDRAGNVWISGDTSAPLPTTPGAFDQDHNGSGDCFVAAFVPDLSQLLYSSYLGGIANDPDAKLALDQQGHVYVTSYTSSVDFPITPGVLRTQLGLGGTEPLDVFVTRLDPLGGIADRDRDGMPDVWEVEHGLDPLLDDTLSDPDGDDLANIEEYGAQTDPQNADSDGDGFSDGEEVSGGSDPLDAESVPALVVTFPDPNLEAAIREAIGKPTGHIYDTDLVGLTTLNASGRGIVNLEGLQYCFGLTNLNLYYNQITSIDRLGGLTNLRYVELGRNQIASIDGLAGLTNLRDLHLYSNQITSIDPLAGLGNLTNLYLYNNQIASIDALAGLINLRSLLLYHNQ
ncbi:MAG: SBBP repeat-containing protein, partial [Candidatus Hydrogenedentes bacterium]|nr:SBBP repeat-containing protein [Candidatus Hydrogenedentota bacterium]